MNDNDDDNDDNNDNDDNLFYRIGVNSKSHTSGTFSRH